MKCSAPRPKVCILGAGISGMLAAIALDKQKFHVTLLDKTSSTNIFSTLDYPIVLPYHAIELLGEHSRIIQNLLNSGAVKTHSKDLLGRFKNHKSQHKINDEYYFISCRKSLFLNLLNQERIDRGIDLKHGQIEQLKIINRKINFPEIENRSDDFIIDATGSKTKEPSYTSKNLIETFKRSGPDYTVAVRFYRSKSNHKLFFSIQSHSFFKGGLYPTGDREFALCYVLPIKNKNFSVKDFHNLLLEDKENRVMVENAEPISDINLFRPIQNKRSNFFRKGSIFEQVDNFLPVGDRVIVGNPIYGRGITLTLLQIESFIHSIELKEGSFRLNKNEYLKRYRRIENIWKIFEFNDLSDDSSKSVWVYLSKLTNKYYRTILHPLSKIDSLYYQDVLDFYHFKGSPVKISSLHHHLNGIKYYIKKQFEQRET